MESIELTTLLRPLRRWWWLVLAGALLAGISSFAYVNQQPPRYVSRTTLMVGSVITDPNPSGTEISLAQQLARTYADIAKREPLRLATMAALGLETLPDYAVQVLPNTQIIEIQVFAGNPQLIYTVATALAEQLILQGPAGREQQERDQFVEAELSELQTSITETRNEIRQKQQELSTLFSAREIERTQSLIGALEGKLTSQQANYAALLATTQQGASNILTILEPANLPTRPINAQLTLNVLIAVLLGVVLAAVGAYLIEFLDDSFKSAEEAQELFKAPILTSVPTLSSRTAEEKVVMLKETPVLGMEAYRLLRVNLEFTAIDQPLKLLVVAGTSAQDGKSLTAANLAAAYARAGKRVTLVDADLHRPSQQRLFKLTNNRGLTTALFSDEFPLESLLQATAIARLHLLTAGPLPPNPGELLGSKRMQGILAKLKETADLVIIDSPPLATVTDGIVLATQADGVIMVVRAGKTRRTRAHRAQAALSQVKARLLGIVYNGATIRDSEYRADYGYYRHFANGSAAAAKIIAPDFELTPQKTNGSATPPKAKNTAG